MPNDSCPMGYDCSLMTGYSCEFCHNRKICQEVALTLTENCCSNDVPNPIDWEALASLEEAERSARLYQLGYQHASPAIVNSANREGCDRV